MYVELRVVPIALAALLAAPVVLAAEEPPTPIAPPSTPHFELGARGGWVAPPIRGGTNPFGAGLGARLGYAGSLLYLGATAVGFFGSSDVDTSNHAALYGGELGASFHLMAGSSAYVVIRPHLGIGGATVFHTEPAATTSSTTTRPGRTRDDTLAGGTDVITAASSSGTTRGGSASSTDTTSVTTLYLEPGVTALFSSGSPSGGQPFVGANASVLYLPSAAYGGQTASAWLTYSVGAELGVYF